MNLIEALEELKKGKKIRRKEWNNKERYISFKKGCLRTEEGKIKYGIHLLTPSELTDDNWELYKDKRNKETQYKIDSMKFQIIRHCKNEIRYSCTSCKECLITKLCNRTYKENNETPHTNTLDDWSLKEIVEAYRILKEAGEI